MDETLNLELFSSPHILDAMPDGVYLTDCNRKIIFWNKAAERITGWSRSDVIGKHCADNILVHIDKDGNKLCCEESCPLYRSIVTGEQSETPLLVFAQAQSGRRIPVEVSVAPLLDASGVIMGGVEIFRDMTMTMQDLNRARLIQKSILRSPPIDDPRLKIAMRCIPHDMVGGDFLHVEPLDVDHYAVFVADVTGHGVAAALYTMELRALWDEYRHQLAAPSEFMAALNVRLNALANQNDYFATAVHFLVNATTGEISYSCAGHESPLLIKSDGSVLKLSEKDPCLGLCADTVYHENAEHLSPGESLVIFTDGAIEINDIAGAELGSDGLSRMVSQQDFRDPNTALSRIESELLKYSHQIRLPDDMSLLCLYRAANN